MLVDKAPNLVTHEMLASEVWGSGRIVSPENLAQRVMMLRRSLGDPADQPRYIEGVRSQGYRLIPPVTGLSSESRLREDHDGSAVRPLRNSIAVLPFESLRPDFSDSELAAGIHADIINQLAKLKNVNVINAGAVQHFAVERKPIQQISQELNVATVLEGAVQVCGTDVRITVQLINPRTKAVLWAESYDRDVEDVLSVRTDIAVNVAKSLRQELSDNDLSSIQQRPTESPKAYALCLQALGLRGQVNSGSRMHAILESAIELDCEFVEAYGLAANLHAISIIDTGYGDAVDSQCRPELEGLARGYATRALALNPTLTIAMAALAVVEMFTWRWSDAHRIMIDARQHGWHTDQLAWILSWFGMHDEAIQRARKLVEANPNDWGGHRDLGFAYAYAREYHAALDCLETTIAMVPSAGVVRAWLAYVLVALGRRKEAFAALELIEGLIGANGTFVFLPELAYCYGRVGEKQRASGIFERISSIGQAREIGAGSWAMAYLAIGDRESALSSLATVAAKAKRREPDPGLINLMNLKKNFTADPLLEQPEFAAALEAIRGD